MPFRTPTRQSFAVETYFHRNLGRHIQILLEEVPRFPVDSVTEHLSSCPRKCTRPPAASHERRNKTRQTSHRTDCGRRTMRWTGGWNPIASQRPAGRSFRLPGLGIPVILFLFLVVRPDSANASCGNYLYKNGQPVSSHPMTRVDTDVSADAVSDHDKPAPLPVTPCRGPNCSGNRIPLLPVPAPISLERLSDSAVLSKPGSAISHHRHVGDVPESESGAFFEPGSVFRPPAAARRDAC